MGKQYALAPKTLSDFPRMVDFEHSFECNIQRRSTAAYVIQRFQNLDFLLVQVVMQIRFVHGRAILSYRCVVDAFKARASPTWRSCAAFQRTITNTIPQSSNSVKQVNFGRWVIKRLG
ncbi:MAG: hypothetical protein GY859_29925 [Desulfobacterales bacterium]|nr:hypothetical protein [Desulfobacterales bacterium]